MAHRGRTAKADEDRHIGFRWLRWEARLEDERDAERVFRAVAAELSRRLGADEARHVEAHLPLGLRLVWQEEAHPARRPERFGAEELVERVRVRLGLAEREEAAFLVTVVLAWLRHLAPEERADVAALLPADLRDLWERAHLPQVPRWRALRLGPRPAGDGTAT